MPFPFYPTRKALRQVISPSMMRKHTPDVASLMKSGGNRNIGRGSNHYQFHAQHVSSAGRGTELSRARGECSRLRAAALIPAGTIARL